MPGNAAVAQQVWPSARRTANSRRGPAGWVTSPPSTATARYRVTEPPAGQSTRPDVGSEWTGGAKHGSAVPSAVMQR
ncbi:hypothetical protein C3486_03945 [Streptomyces sp. Ru73]|nr:hypothetical protein C3486_03945 [Streptomyces sp. Ru73]